jgi:hypothetical protein
MLGSVGVLCGGETNGRVWRHPAVVLRAHVTEQNRGRGRSNSASLSAKSHALGLAAKPPDET